MLSISPNLHRQLCALLPRLAAEIFSERFDTDAKGSDGLDFVTSIDLKMQDRLTTILPELLLGSRVVGEEGFCQTQDSTAPLWLVDPLDGTVNFVAGLPSYAIAVVLIDNGQPCLAAVHDVPHGITYSAIADGGAFRNGAPLVRRQHDARLAVLSSGLLRDLSCHAPDRLAQLLARYKLRNFGSQALHLCYAAAGHVSLVASREAKGWDDLAGALIAREAGLQYGPYHGSQAAMDVDQFSLCSDPATFEAHVSVFSGSVP
ncbi:MAG: inositol monophosphatase [Rhodobacteraceae bacterium]|nr:inositol monophosphatase [Paracoccaceae bacterium]